jgi:hypothetical protein
VSEQVSWDMEVLAMGSRFDSMIGTANLALMGSITITDNLHWSRVWNDGGATANNSLPWPGERGPRRHAAIGTSGAAWGDTSMGSGVAIGTTSGVNAGIGAWFAPRPALGGAPRSALEVGWA